MSKSKNQIYNDDANIFGSKSSNERLKKDKKVTSNISDIAKLERHIDNLHNFLSVCVLLFVVFLILNNISSSDPTTKSMNGIMPSLFLGIPAFITMLMILASSAELSIKKRKVDKNSKK